MEREGVKKKRYEIKVNLYRVDENAEFSGKKIGSPKLTEASIDFLRQAEKERQKSLIAKG